MDHSRGDPPRVTEEHAENQERALAVVQRLLQERGVRAHRHSTIILELSVTGRQWPDPPVQSSVERQPPELAVIGPQGWRDATVTVGQRSGSYMVSVRGGPALQTVRSEHPEQVVDLIIAARSDKQS